jgi:hypothetical protein
MVYQLAVPSQDVSPKLATGTGGLGRVQVLDQVPKLFRLYNLRK